MLNLIKKHFVKAEPKALVLMYHRVCNIKTDPWELAVSPKNFESQINELKKHYTILPISALFKQFDNLKIKNRSVYITFDDTYQDNFTLAKPILEKHQCPATFFVPNYFTGKQQMFWWDELENIFLHTNILPKTLTLTIKDNTIEFKTEVEVLTDTLQRKQQDWTWHTAPPTRRCELYLEIWSLLKPCSLIEINKIMNSIKIWAKYEQTNLEDNFAMKTEQLSELINNKLFSLGFHTETHLSLHAHEKPVQLKEIMNNKAFFTQNNLKNVNAIAFPYGDYNNDTISSIKELKIELGFTTKAECITKKSNPFILGRIQVPNCSGADLIEKLTEILN
ncbi:hypothetical protein PK35_01760 [Tamlana nanhaiensis]|uniref:NodB homology domain-containing protein n=1 Tax=Neotamlana nanhaiensis TaxID=1382798 RepID=A0A0D7W684_9FLAO|nr:polysaccharide deacetylase family protein [Tamlana nanhaiensis]KJD34539.1 hypothetical protein PK35_01760 [Tamlana nanhaiensis]